MPIDFSKLQEAEMPEQQSANINFASIPEAEMPSETLAPAPSNKIDIINKQYEDINKAFDNKIKSIQDNPNIADEDKITFTDAIKIKQQQAQKQLIDEKSKEEERIKNSQQYINPVDIELSARGFARPVLGAMRAFNNYFGNVVSDKDRENINNWIADNEDAIDKVMKDNNIKPESFNQTSIGSMLFDAGLPLRLAKGIIPQSILFGGGEALKSYGSGKSGEESAIAGAEAGVESLVTLGLLKGTGNVVKELASTGGRYAKGLITGLDPNALALAEKSGLSLDETKKILDGIPKNQQSRKIAEAGGENVLSYYRKALEESDKASIKVQNEINDRYKQIKDISNTNDIKAIDEAENLAWETLKEEANKSNIKVDMSGLSSQVENLKKGFAGTDETVKGWINAFENTALKEPMSLQEAIAIRKQVNNKMDSLKGKPGFEQLSEFKNAIDARFNEEIPTEYQKLLDVANNATKKTYEVKKLNDILRQASTEETVTGKTNMAIDYGKALELIKEDKSLKGTTVEQTVDALKQFQDKFGTDYAIRPYAKTRGTQENESVIGFYGQVLGVLKRNFLRVGESGENLGIQQSLLRSIKNAKSPTDFVDSVIKEKNIDVSIKKDLMDAVNRIEWKKQADANRIKATNANLNNQIRLLGN